MVGVINISLLGGVGMRGGGATNLAVAFPGKDVDKDFMWGRGWKDEGGGTTNLAVASLGKDVDKGSRAVPH